MYNNKMDGVKIIFRYREGTDMWICPKCETKNDDMYCDVCGERKPEETYAPPVIEEVYTPAVEEVYYPPVKEEVAEKKSRKTGLIIALVSVCSLLLLLFIGIGVLEVNYSQAKTAFESGNYVDAKQKFQKISFYKNSQEMITECTYQKAAQLLFDGNEEEAMSVFESIADYKNSMEFIQECKYSVAVKKRDSGDFMGAYEDFAALDGYKDSAKQINLTKDKIYNAGIKEYANKNFTQAKYYFEISENRGNEEKYLRLINVHTQNPDDVSGIYDLIGFEDAEDIVKKDAHLLDFLMGRWENGSGDYIYYYKNAGDTTTWCHWMIPSYGGDHWELTNGISYQIQSNGSRVKDWSFDILDRNTIKVYCYKSGSYYTLYRR